LIDLSRLGSLQKWSGPLQTHFVSNGGDDASPPSPNGSSEPSSRGPADGLHALLVEDQTIIALDTESMLLDLGAASVHSFATVDAALTWLAAAKADIGLLDISLGTTTSFPVADALQQRAVPFKFTTGYGDSGVIPDRFLDVPIVRKPYTLQALAEAVAKCIRPRRLDA
jgi:DNA-binding NtrC family response regulator